MSSFGGKLPGKQVWSGRRRPMTRTSGYSVHGPGNLLKVESVDGYELAAGEDIIVEFYLPPVTHGDILGFGGWYYKSTDISVKIEGSLGRSVLIQPSAPNWGKFGSQWYSDGSVTTPVQVIFHANAAGVLALYGLTCGRVMHDYLANARPELMTNMFQFAPEANFIEPEDEGNINVRSTSSLRHVSNVADISLKSCNRCARFLPVNLNDETIHLSFTNHCSAQHLRPCKHSGFGRLVNIATLQPKRLEYGFQLECRFCKKFEVNSAHNPQRTASQMKEDAARRRAFELLLEYLYAGTPQLRYRIKTGRELAEDVWNKFKRQCFKCGVALDPINMMHLDHTRPLALLWPLDETATALCGSCNSEKRDRPPIQYYESDEKLHRLSEITGIPFQELCDPSPNVAALDLLGQRLDWFYNEFLTMDALTREHDGKIPAELLVKALNKVLAKYPGGAPYRLHTP